MEDEPKIDELLRPLVVPIPTSTSPTSGVNKRYSIKYGHSSAVDYANKAVAGGYPLGSFGDPMARRHLGDPDLFRLVTREHKFNLKLTGWPYIFRLKNLYHTLLELTWWKLFLILSIVWVWIHVLFACLFFIGGPDGISEMGDEYNFQFFVNCVYFSIQAGATIGFGRWSPVSNFANIIVSTETIFQLIWTTVLTGFVFHKISRPSLIARQIMFSSAAVVNKSTLHFHRSGCSTTIGGHRCLNLRLLNPRHSMLCDPIIRLFLLRRETLNGELPDPDKNEPLVFRMHELNFELTLQQGRARSCHVSAPYLPLPWNLVHAIDDSSPLHNITPELAELSEMELIVLLEGVDEGCSNSFQARYSYLPQDILWGHTFVERDQKTSKYIIHLDLLSSTLHTEPEGCLPDFNEAIRDPGVLDTGNSDDEAPPKHKKHV